MLLVIFVLDTSTHTDQVLKGTSLDSETLETFKTANRNFDSIAIPLLLHTKVKVTESKSYL